MAYVALYCGPIVNQSFLDKIWLVYPAQCLSIVRGKFHHYLQKMNFQQNPNAGQNGDHLKRLCRQVLAVACPRVNGSNAYAKL